MIDRHIQARHPKSSHRFTKCSGQPCNLDVLSDSESPSSQLCKEASNCNSCDTETPIKDKSSTAQRLKLTPLEGKRTLNYDNTQDRTRITQSSDLYQLSHLPPLCPIATTSYTSTITANTTISSPSEIISSSTDSKKPGLPLARIKPRMSSSTKNICSDSSVEITRNPLTVVISSPNDSATQERLVKVNPSLDKVHVVEVVSTDDDTVTHQETCNSIDDSGTHERVVEFILNNSKPQDRSRRNNINTNNYLSQGNNIVVKRNRRSTRAQMTMVKNSKNDNHDKVSQTVGNNLCDTTSKETNKSKEALPSLSGTSDTSRKVTCNS